MNAAARLLVVLLGGMAVILFSGCQRAHEEDDFLRAQEAFIQQDAADATMLFERYLRKHPQGDKRWYVWQQLLSLALFHWQDRETAREYLEIMLEEYADDPFKRQGCEMQLADLAYELKDYPRAISLWENLAAKAALPPERQAALLRKLSSAHMRRLDFVQSTNTLRQCVRLAVPDAVRAECLYDLAVVQTVSGSLAEAEEALRALLNLPEAGEERKILSAYTLADVLEQQEKYQEAADWFSAIQGSYPNEKVIQLRLNNVRKKLKK